MILEFLLHRSVAVKETCEWRMTAKTCASLVTLESWSRHRPQSGSVSADMFSFSTLWNMDIKALIVYRTSNDENKPHSVVSPTTNLNWKVGTFVSWPFLIFTFNLLYISADDDDKKNYLSSKCCGKSYQQLATICVYIIKQTTRYE